MAQALTDPSAEAFWRLPELADLDQAEIDAIIAGDTPAGLERVAAAYRDYVEQLAAASGKLTEEERYDEAVAAWLRAGQDERHRRGDFSATLGEELAHWTRDEQRFRLERQRRGLPVRPPRIVRRPLRSDRSAPRARPRATRPPRRAGSRASSAGRDPPSSEEPSQAPETREGA